MSLPIAVSRLAATGVGTITASRSCPTIIALTPIHRKASFALPHRPIPILDRHRKQLYRSVAAMHRTHGRTHRLLLLSWVYFLPLDLGRTYFLRMRKSKPLDAVLLS